MTGKACLLQHCIKTFIGFYDILLSGSFSDVSRGINNYFQVFFKSQDVICQGYSPLVFCASELLFLHGFRISLYYLGSYRNLSFTFYI